MKNKDKNKKLICPKCHRYFGTLDITSWPDIASKHVRILAGDKKKLRDGDSLACSLCSYEYTTHDVILTGASHDSDETLKPGEESKT